MQGLDVHDFDVNVLHLVHDGFQTDGFAIAWWAKKDNASLPRDVESFIRLFGLEEASVVVL